MVGARRLSQLSELKLLRAELERDAEERARREREAAVLAARKQAEGSVFAEAVKDVRPIKAAPRVESRAHHPSPVARQHLADEQSALVESISDDFDAETLLETDADLSWRRDGLGPEVVRKLRRGHWIIQDQIDLHGARRDEARELLAGFLKYCIKRGLRCIRVVHGKGHGSVGRQPVLKGKVRTWLLQKDEVLAFCQARPQDGGGGALLVLLRPSRPDGG